MTTTATSPLHAEHVAAGATFDPSGSPMPLWYNAPEAVAAEYESAREAAAMVELAEHGVLAVTGPDRQKFLNAMLSNDILGRRPGEGCRAALMDVKGRLAVLVRALIAEDTVWLEMPARRMEPVEGLLRHYKVAAPVRFQATPMTILGVLGPHARQHLGHAGLDVPDLAPEAHASVALGTHALRVAPAGDLPASGYVLHVLPEAAPDVWRALLGAGVRPLGRHALDVLRVEEGQAWYGPDVSEDNLLHETGLVGACHSSTKGCYLGQEVVARLEARGGKVSQALRGLRLDRPVTAGTAVFAGDEQVGRVTTAGVSPRLGAVALAYVHRKHFEAGTNLQVGPARAQVQLLPLAAAGAAGE